MLGKNLSNSSGAIQTTYVDDVFSAYTYTGNGSTQTITNGIDLAGKGGLVWSKSRNAVNAGELRDSVRGTAILQSSTTAGQLAGASDVTAFNSSGYNLGFVSGTANQGSTTFVGWTFRKAPKFFDVVTYTGNGATSKLNNHSLGQVPGMIIVKRTDSTNDWTVWHRSLSTANKSLFLNTTAAEADNLFSGLVRLGTSTATTFTCTGYTSGNDLNINGATYVAYLFAHDTGTDGIVQCGSFTTDGSGMASVTLGWEPQYLLFKPSNSGLQDWRVCDSSRGFTAKGSTDAMLYPNLSSAEYGGNSQIYPTATGFGVDALPDTLNWVYLAIRRPNKPPTVGTQVYNAIARTGNQTVTSITGVGFAPDLAMCCLKSSAGFLHPAADRLRGANKQVYTTGTNVEATNLNEVNSFNVDGITLGNGSFLGYWNTNSQGSINYFFKRAPGVFDVVCYTGNGTTNAVSHSLGVVPELAIFKGRTVTGDWFVNIQALSTIYATVFLNTSAATSNNALYTSTPTASAFTFTGTNVNNNTQTYVAYLFATKAGISKVGSYTGNATTNQINCGFTTGARFVLIKRTDSTGDWYVWDTVRGIIAGNDPYLLLNSTAAEVTSTDYIDPYTAGFELSSTAPAAINASGGTYIYLAFA